ncbi:MAG: Rossmann-like and DUF2520 domain-containing protein [Saprospiraceae bacterium]
MAKSKTNICLIGAGNLAHHLALRLFQQDIYISQIFSRKKKNATVLAKLVSTKATHKISEITTDADLYIIAVSDGAIGKVAEKLSEVIDPKKSLVVHTSGATPSTILQKHFKHFGVFYPLQSFSKEKAVDFSSIPICIDAKYKRDLKRLEKIGQQLSNKVFTISDEQRATLHVAAVFVNNFSNLMYRLSDEILAKKELPFDLLRPLLLETALKVQEHSPKDMQTGPAARGDQETMDRHIDYLKEEHPDLWVLYQKLSAQIRN